MGEQSETKPTTDEIMNAASLDELVKLFPDFNDWYEKSDGHYDEFPTWGPETDEVSDRIMCSGPDGDIISWDTLATPNRYLMRENGSDGNKIYIEGLE